MTIPVGLAPGGIKGAAAYPADHLELPGNAQVARIPSNVQFQSGPLSYTANCLLEGSVLKISRDYTARHTKSVCNSQDD